MVFRRNESFGKTYGNLFDQYEAMSIQNAQDLYNDYAIKYVLAEILLNIQYLI